MHARMYSADMTESYPSRNTVATPAKQNCQLLDPVPASLLNCKQQGRRRNEEHGHESAREGRPLG